MGSGCALPHCRLLLARMMLQALIVHEVLIIALHAQQVFWR